MASGKKSRQAQLDKTTATTTGLATDAAREQMKATPLQQAADANAMKVLNNQGDWKDNKEVNWAGGQLAYLKGEQAAKNRGAYTMGSQYADPNLLAAMGSQEEANAAQQDSLGFENAVGNAKSNAQNYALNSAGQTAQRIGSVMNPMAGMANNFSQQATSMAMQPGFWSQALLAGIGGAGSALQGSKLMMSDGRMKENVQKLTQLNGVSFDWDNAASELGLSGRDAGVIAQEVENVFPGLVDNSSDYKRVNYTALTGLLVETLKSLAAENARLKGEICQQSA